MIHSGPLTPRTVKDMVSYFETKGDPIVERKSGRRTRSMKAMMNFTRRPWEHFPRRKSSSSTNHRRRSSVSTGSESSSYEPAEEQLADSFYAASERSGTSTVVSDDRRRSANPDYDWEHDGDHDDIADIKANLHSIKLWSPPPDAQAKDSETSELHKVDSADVEEKKVGTAPPGVHEIDFVDRAIPRMAERDPTQGADKDDSGIHHNEVNNTEATSAGNARDDVQEAVDIHKPAVSDTDISEAAETPALPDGARTVPVRTSSASVASKKPSHLNLKTTYSDKECKSLDATSPSSPSPKSKARAKLAPDLPGIPESDAETLGRQRRPPLRMLRQAPGQSQAMHVNKSSRPPVSMRRYPVRSISAPLPGQAHPLPPTQMMDLVSQRQVKFTNIREEKIRRLSSLKSGSAPQNSQGFMGRRHASAPVAETAPRKLSGMRPAKRPSLAERFSISKRLSISKRRQSFSQAIKEYIRSSRRRPSFLSRRRRSMAE